MSCTNGVRRLIPVPSRIPVIIAVLIATVAFAAEIDITDYIIEMMECNATAYEKHADSSIEFNRAAFDLAWDACGDVRERMLDAIPERMRPEWEARFETIRTSMIDRFNAIQPSQPGYGLNPGEPVLIGGIDDGARRTYEYFSRLRSLDGHSLQVKRIGSCCPFETPNAVVGSRAVLDKYEIMYDGLDVAITVYVNIYDEGATQPVKGFVFRSDA